MVKTVVIGAGAMGLAAAYHALKLGHEVEVVEADRQAGGMAAHFDFGGLSIERFYHFICKPDAPTFALLKDLGIEDRRRWRETSMGYFIGGKLHKWGDPVSLLTSSLLNPIEKLRYGAQMFLTSKRRSFDDLETVSAKDWIEKGSGKSVYDKLWRQLMGLKFYQYADNVSAAWIATRIRRIGNSRKSLLQEELGYLEGGSQTLVDALVALSDRLQREREGGAWLDVEAVHRDAILPRLMMYRLRAKVDDDFAPKLIHTLRGAGYCLREPE